jgi:WD40 repeat protein
MSRCLPTALLLALLAAASSAAPAPAGAYQFTVQSSHTDKVKNIVFSADGRRILSASSDKTIKLWDVESGRLIRNFAGPTQPLTCCALSPDDALVAGGGYDRTVTLWDASTGDALRSWNLDTAIIGKAAFSPDGAILAAGMVGAIFILDPRGVKPPVKIEIGNAMPECLVFSPDGKTIAVGTDTGKVLLVDLDSAAIGGTLSPESYSIHSIAFSPDGKKLAAVGGFNKTLSIWDLGTKSRLDSCKPHSHDTRALAYSEDGKLLYTASFDGSFATWDSATLKEISRYKWLKNLDAGGFCAAIHPATRRVAGAMADRSIGVFSLDDGRLASELHGYSLELRAAALSGDRELLISTEGWSQVINVWDLAAGKMLRSLTGHAARITDLAFSHGRTAASSSVDGTIILWDPREGKELLRLKEEAIGYPCIALSPDGSRLVACSNDRGIWVFDAKTGGLLWKDPKPFRVRSVGVSPDGRLAAVCTLAEGIQIWDLASAKQVAKFSFRGKTGYNASFSPDGRYLVAGYEDNKVRLWNLATGELASTGESHQSPVVRVAFGPDGSHIASVDYEGRLIEWGMTLIAPLRELKDDRNSVACVEWLGPDKVVTVSSTDGVVKMRTLDGSAWTAMKSHPNNHDWLAFSKDGFWDASSRGGETVGVTIGDAVYGIDQFAARTNRPDKVTLPFFADAGRQAYFESRYRLRLSRLGLSEQDASPAPGAGLATAAIPESRIASCVIKDGEARLELAFEAPPGGLRSYSLFVNDVPLFGARGKGISGTSVRAEERVRLSSGENKIEVSCFDAAGAESPRAQVRAKGPAGAKTSLYFVGFGVSKYLNKVEGRSMDLRYAAQDALDLEAFFKKNKGKKFDKVYTKVFADAAATRESLGAARELLERAGIDDTVVVFVAGHGLYDASDTYYFLGHEADTANLAGTAIPFETIEDLVQGLASRKKLLLMDTCASGMREGEVGAATAVAGARGIGARVIPADSARGLAVSANATSSSQWRYERDRFFFNDLTRRSGAIVFSSCTGDQVSWESDDFKNGLFTEFILKGLEGAADFNKDKSIDSDELRKFVSEAVLAETKGKYPSEQLPVVDRDNLSLRLVLPGGK